ncbi:MAG: choice-of-anchor V domain-containing protein [Pyrinomonadaceae bacterium]
MRIVTGRSAMVKSIIILVFAGFFGIFCIFGFGDKAAASAQGPSPSHTDAPGEDNCTACHISFPVNSGAGSVQILGVPASYFPNQPIQITVTTSELGANAYGFQITAIDGTGVGRGTFTLPVQSQPKMQIVNNLVGGTLPRSYVEHTEDGLFTIGQFGSNSWTFTWTAPPQTAGQIVFYAAGNGADGFGNPTGDYIYTTTRSSVPATPTSVTIAGKILTPDGRGVQGAKVVLTGNGVTRNILTSSFGFYSFPDVTTGQSYTLNVQSKSYRFASKTVFLISALSNFDSTGQE